MHYRVVCAALLLAGGLFVIDTGLSQANDAGINTAIHTPVVEQTSIGAKSPNSANATDAQQAAAQNTVSSENDEAALPQQMDNTERNHLSAADLSPFSMFAAADWVVKTVMGGLLALSALTWIIFIAKTLELAGLRRQSNAVLDSVLQSETLSAAINATRNEKGAAAELVIAAAKEFDKSHAAVLGAGDAGLKERIASLLTTIQLKGRRKASKTIGIVATVGSVAPFIGLFGTVWGIMNSFIGIAETQSTGLSTVAPGIAEALLATAIGLFAAIPATIIFNSFVRSIAAYKNGLTDIAAAVERLVSRDLDFASAGIKNRDTSRNK